MTTPGASGVTSKGLNAGSSSISKGQPQTSQSSSAANNKGPSTAANNSGANPPANAENPAEQDARMRMKNYKDEIAKQKKELKILELQNVDSTK